jgi:hypothetical protein
MGFEMAAATEAVGPLVSHTISDAESGLLTLCSRRGRVPRLVCPKSWNMEIIISFFSINETLVRFQEEKGWEWST